MATHILLRYSQIFEDVHKNLMNFAEAYFLPSSNKAPNNIESKGLFPSF